MRTFLMVLGVGFAALNAALWFSTPAIRDAVDASYGRLDAPGRPTIVYGVQELLVYFDPWLARFVFPVVFTCGFALIPFLGASAHSDASQPTTSMAYGIVAFLFMVFLEAVWLCLIWVGVWCRGPNWNFYWPHENWDPWRVEVLNTVNLSDYVWLRLLSVASPGDLSWLVRESPGLVLIAAYFLLGAALTFRLRWKRPGFWRLLTATILFQLALLVLIKIASHFLFNLKYFVSIPELPLNI